MLEGMSKFAVGKTATSGVERPSFESVEAKIAVGKTAKSGAENPSFESVEVDKAGSEMLRNCLNLSRDKAASEEVATEKADAELAAKGSSEGKPTSEPTIFQESVLAASWNR